jgi:predicted unusual protein kinase regulating ubiquinone biosynthesis (AarF/ABC1/UbiB family)
LNTKNNHLPYFHNLNDSSNPLDLLDENINHKTVVLQNSCSSNPMDLGHTTVPYQRAKEMKYTKNTACNCCKEGVKMATKACKPHTSHKDPFKNAFTQNQRSKTKRVNHLTKKSFGLAESSLPGADTTMREEREWFSLKRTCDSKALQNVVPSNVMPPSSLSLQYCNFSSEAMVSPTGQMSTTSAKSLRHDTHHDADPTSARAKFIQEIITALGALKGPMVKMAQMAGMIPGLLPDDCAQALLTLCTTAPAMHPSLLGRKMQLEWGKDWHTRFSDFDQKAMAAASLGQIHRATLHDGTVVAVKVQYPAMKQAIQGDLALFKMLLHRWALDNALDMQDFPREWEQRLYEELDYACEIKHMACWRELFKDYPLIHIPIPFPHLTTEQILTMSWSSAQGIQTAFHQDQDLRNDLGKKIFWAWYYPFYHAGMLHGDPHMGNMAWFCQQLPVSVTETALDKKLFYEKNGQIHIFDFGCVRIFSPMFVQGFCHLYQGLLNKNQELTQQAYTELGFTDLTQPMIMALNDWAYFLLAPFLYDQECLLEELSCPKKALAAMQHLEKTLKSHGGTKIPPEFLIFDRVAVILGAVLMRLQVKTNWYGLMAPLVQSFCLKKCRADQKRLLEICKKNDILY